MKVALNGLPPSPSEINALEDAVERLGEEAYDLAVEQALSSPRYGERMVMDWLDVARYADTHGFEGRVDRANGTHQDRLVKKLHFREIAAYGPANEYLTNEYLPEHNERFQGAPASEADYHSALPRGLDLRQVFCLEAERVVGADMVVRFENRFLQLRVKRNQPVWQGMWVTVR